MADGADLVKLKLTFWHKGKEPGDTVDVRRDELHQWRGFAVPADDEPAEQPETKPNETAPSTEDPAPAAKPSRSKQA